VRVVHSRRFDVVIHGATGFTGQHAAGELNRAASKDLRWAISGRNADRLREMSAELGCEYIVADSLSDSQLNELTMQTQVMLSCAGPFAAFGEKLVAACVKNKCHYADLTGESHWAIKMAARYGAAATDNEVTLIPSSGFDSVPASLGAQHYLQRIAMDGRQIKSFGSYYSMRGGLNGGTLASGLQLAEDGLSVPDSARPGVFKVTALNKYASEFVMAPINERVVSLDTNVDYHEHLLTPNKFSAYLVKWYFDLMGWMISHKFGRSVLRKLGPKPGEGPSEKVIAEGFVKQTFIEDDCDDPTKLVFTWPGDPGNTVTVRCLIHTGLALAAGEAQAVGFTTPAAGLGDKLLQRLLAAGACSYECTPDWMKIYNAGEFHYDSSVEAKSVTLITAWNPNSKEMPDTWNAEANVRLANELRELGYEFGDSYGCSPAGEEPYWREEGFAVYDLSIDQAYDLGAKWGQRAVVYNACSKQQMLFCHSRQVC